MALLTPQAAVARLPELAGSLEKVKDEVRRGLSAKQKTLSPWLFYDQEGSQLFERITELDEYYLTRTERGILEENADDIVRAACGDRRARVIELGAGSGVKTELVLRALLRRQTSLEYLPTDVSPSALQEARARLEGKIAHLQVAPRVEDYTSGIAPFPHDGISALVLWIGSSIGNFNPRQRERVLRLLRARMMEGDALLLGTDNAKAEPVLLAAYNDAAGVTAAFNKNVLVRLNRELDANFDVDGFEHRAIWNASESRIEMHLVSRYAQAVAIPATEQALFFSAGETIHTENSYKFTRERVAAMLKAAGFSLAHSWTDAQGWFGVHLAVVK
jgi:dimethylhistidine N-methyltransferase